jgi:hypothetical protein
MPAHSASLILVTVLSIGLLLALILLLKLHAFLALLISSMALGVAAGMPPDKLLKSIQFGFGDALGFVAVVVGLGAMIGRYLEYSGGGRALADWLLEKFGKERAAWAMLVAALLVGLPIFFEVGFVIMAPLVFNLTRETKRSLLFYGLPMAGALTITHSLVPPHPAPAAAAQLLGADLGRAILYGIALSIPLAVISGIVYGGWIAKRMYAPGAVSRRSGVSGTPVHGPDDCHPAGAVLFRHTPRADPGTRGADGHRVAGADGVAAGDHGRGRGVQAGDRRFRSGRGGGQVAGNKFDFAPAGGVSHRHGDAHRARVGHGGDHYRGGDRGAHRQGTPRL